MAFDVAGSEIIQAVQIRLGVAAFGSSTRPTLSQAQAMVVDSARDLSSVLHSIGDDNLIEMVNVTTTPNSSVLDLSAFVAPLVNIKKIHWRKGPQDNVPLRRAKVDEWANASETSGRGWEYDVYYRATHDKLYVWPTPSAAYPLTIWYGKTLEVTFDENSTSMHPWWKEWIVSDVCHKLKLPEEKYAESQHFLAEREACEQKIRAAAPRDEWGVVQMRDVWSYDDRTTIRRPWW